LDSRRYLLSRNYIVRKYLALLGYVFTGWGERGIADEISLDYENSC